MDHYSILDQSAAATNRQPAMPPVEEPRSTGMSVSAAIAAANARNGSVLGREARGLRFPAEDNGQSLGEMAERDLDAALQLLADRAQYITGATGAAIALRRKNQNDMLCRASTGSNAPELGALLSAEFGLSGESVRTRSPLRCDDTERDPRVNREGCRQLGIASVVVMPIVSEDQVLGVFELFSGRVNAFSERDMSALHRLGQMVETAVGLADAAKAAPQELPSAEETSAGDDLLTCEILDVDEPMVVVEVAALESSEGAVAASATAPRAVEIVAAAATTPQTEAPKKPLMWTAALQTAAAAQPAGADQSHVPLAMRNLKKCHACGFPITEGRLLCVECEEKKWKGQLRTSMAASAKVVAPTVPVEKVPAEKAVAPVVAAPVSRPATLAEAMAAVSAAAPAPAKVPAPVAPVVSSVPESKIPASPSQPLVLGDFAASKVEIAAPSPASNGPDLPILSAGISSSESWLSTNKYVLGAIGAVAAAVAAIVLLR